MLWKIIRCTQAVGFFYKGKPTINLTNYQDGSCEEKAKLMMIILKGERCKMLSYTS